MDKFQARTIRQIAAAATFFTAMVVLLIAPSRLEYPAAFRLQQYAEIFDSLLTAAIFYASIGLLKGRLGAWFAASSVLGISTIWEIVVSRSSLPPLAILPFLAFLFVISTVRFYRTKSEYSDSRLRPVLLITIVTTLIGCLVSLMVALRYHHSFSLWKAVVGSLRYTYSLTDDFQAITHLHSLQTIGIYLLLLSIGIINYTLIALALLQPVVEDYRHMAPATIRNMLEKYSINSEDYFKLFPQDKLYFTSQLVEGFIAYARHENICIMLADPIGKDGQTRHALLHEFSNWCHGKELRWAAIPVTESSIGLYDEKGLSHLKVGENAVVNLANFSTVTRHNKYFRNIINRFEKAENQITFHEPPHSKELILSLRAVSDQWLARDHGEYGFAMGYFDPWYLNQSKIAVLRDAYNTPIGFINLQPSFTRKRASFDMMRTSDQAPKNAIDFLLAKTCLWLDSQSIDELDFGVAPLSGLEQTDSITEKTLAFISKYARRFYSFHGVRRFKDKFEPHWEPVYLVYQGGRTRLPGYGLALRALLDQTPSK